MTDGRFQLKYPTDPEAFSGATPESRWAIGIMAADGNVRSRVGQVRFGQSLKNLDLLDEMRRHIGHSGEPSFAKTTSSYMLSWTSRRHVDDLARYGVVDAKSLIYRLPDPSLMSLDFLRGYIDGDGCIGVYSNGTHRRYLQLGWVGTPEFIKQCLDWLPVTGRVYTHGNVQEIKFHGKHAADICGLLYPANDNFTSRKQRIFEQHQREAA